MTTLVDLRERLLKAEGPDRELDAEICAALRYYTSPSDVEQSWADDWKGEWRAIGSLVHLLGAHGSGGNFRPAPLTASVDAALALVERKLPAHEPKSPGASWWSISMSLSEGYRYPIVTMGRSYPTNKRVVVEHRTLPLAILIALVDALIATGADLMHGDDTGTGRGGRHQSRRN